MFRDITLLALCALVHCSLLNSVISYAIHEDDESTLELPRDQKYWMKAVEIKYPRENDDVASFEAPVLKSFQVDEKFIRDLILDVPPLNVFAQVCECFEVEEFVSNIRIGFEELLETLKEKGQSFINLLNHLVSLGLQISRLEQDTLRALGYLIQPAIIRTLTLDEVFHVIMIWNNERVPATNEFIQAVLKNLHFYTLMSCGHRHNYRFAIMVNYTRLLSRVDDQDGGWSNAINEVVMFKL